MVKLITIDPAISNTGMAIFIDGKLDAVRHIKNITLVDIEGIINEVAEDDGQFLLGIEMQYSHRNKQTFASLTYVRAAWELEALRRPNCLGIYRVKPSEWQAWHGLTGHTGERKAQSIEIAKQYIEVVPTSDMADAILIGLYILQNFANLPVITKADAFVHRKRGGRHG